MKTDVTIHIASEADRDALVRLAVAFRDHVGESRGSRSFGAKNNDPLEVFVFTAFFERLSWVG
jgi:hypothetical protein